MTIECSCQKGTAREPSLLYSTLLYLLLTCLEPFKRKAEPWGIDADSPVFTAVVVPRQVLNLGRRPVVRSDAGVGEVERVVCMHVSRKRGQ